MRSLYTSDNTKTLIDLKQIFGGVQEFMRSLYTSDNTKTLIDLKQILEEFKNL
jgi:hypothetical protein